MNPHPIRSEYSAHSAMRETARATRYTNAQRAMMQAAIARLDKRRAAKETRERIARLIVLSVLGFLPVALVYIAATN